MSTAPAGLRPPDFLIIGAPKCGTTWLSRRLAAHPSIVMPGGEVHFFSRHWDRGWSWYAEHFGDACADQLIGENSNSYLTDPVAFPRVAKALPGARLICTLRHPVERAYSSYGMQIDRGRANHDIERYLDPARSPRPHILGNGLYAKMLQPWFESFGRERILINFLDDIRADPNRVYQEALRFIGAPDDFVPENLTERENARRNVGVPGPVKRALWWLRPYLDSGPLRTVRTGAVGRWAQAAIARPKSYPPLTPQLARRLADYYDSDLEHLERLIGRPLSAWRERYRDTISDAA